MIQEGLAVLAWMEEAGLEVDGHTLSGAFRATGLVGRPQGVLDLYARFTPLGPRSSPYVYSAVFDAAADTNLPDADWLLEVSAFLGSLRIFRRLVLTACFLQLVFGRYHILEGRKL